MKRFSKILLIIGEERDHSQAAQRAIALAKNNQASLTICAFVDAAFAEMPMTTATITPEQLCDIAVSAKRAKLAEIVETIADKAVAIDTKVLVGKPFVETIRQVLGENYDLVIKSTEGVFGVKATIFGSTDMHLIRKCPCPVWIIKSGERPRYRRILAAVDQEPSGAAEDPLNRQILEMATSLSLSEFCELHIVHAWRLFGENHYRSPRLGIADSEVDEMVAEEARARRRWLEDLLRTYRSETDKDMVDYAKPQLHLIKGDARHAVPAQAQKLNADLVVMGTVGRTGVAGLFIGNTAEEILAQLDCSILTVKPAGFVSPIKLEA